MFAGGSDFDYSPHSLISAAENILIEYQGTKYSLELYFIFLELKDDFSFIAFSGGGCLNTSVFICQDSPSVVTFGSLIVKKSDLLILPSLLTFLCGE